MPEEDCQSIIIRGLRLRHYVDATAKGDHPHCALDARVASITSFMCVSRLSQKRRRGISFYLAGLGD